jgi:hypothetical protein
MLYGEPVLEADMVPVESAWKLCQFKRDNKQRHHDHGLHNAISRHALSEVAQALAEPVAQHHPEN